MAHFSNRMKSAKDWFFGWQGAIASTGLGFFAKSVLDAATALQRIQSALAVATGSTGAARAEFGFIEQTAAKLGLSLESTAQSYSKFAAAARGTSLEGQGARDAFLGVSEAATALGLSADETSGALNALGQMVSKGTVQAEELRGQLGERIPGAFQMAARAMGTTTQGLGKMLEQGQVLASDLLPKLAVEMHKTFGEQAATGAQRLQGQINALGTAWFKFKVAIADSGFGDFAAKSMAATADALNRLSSKIPGLVDDLKALALAFAMLGVGSWLQALAASPAVIGAVQTAIIALRFPTLALTQAWHSLTAAMLANPIGIIIGAVVAFTAASYRMHKALVAVEGAMSDANTAASGGLAQFLKERGEGAGAVQQLETLKTTLDSVKQKLEAAKEAADSFWFKLRSAVSFVDHAGRAANEISTLEQTIQVLQRKIAATEAAAAAEKKAAEDAARLKAAQEAAALKADELRQSFEKLEDALDPSAAAQREYLETTKLLKEALAVGLIPTQERYNQLMREAAKVREEAMTKPGKEAAEALSQLYAGTSDVAAATEQYQATLQKLSEIEKHVLVDEETRNQILDAAREKLDEVTMAEQRRSQARADALKQQVWQQEQGLLQTLDSALKQLSEVKVGLGLEKALKPMDKAALAAKDFVAELRRANPQFFILNENAEAMAAALGDAVYETTLLEEAAKEFDKTFAAGALELTENAVENMQRAFADFFNTLLTEGKLTWKELGKTMLGILTRTISEMLAQWLAMEIKKTLITAKEALKRAYLNKAADAGGGGGGGWWSMAKGLFSKGGGAAASGAGAAGAGGAGVGAGVGGGAWGVGAGGGAWGVGINGSSAVGAGAGSSAGMGALASVAVAAVVVAAVLAITNAVKKNSEAKKYERGLKTGFDSNTGYTVTVQRDVKKMREFADGLNSFWKTFQESTGAMIVGMADLKVKIRHDQKLMTVELENGIKKKFKDVNEAMLFAIKEQFKSADFASALDPAIKAVVENYSGKDVEQLKSNLQFVQGFADAASGMTAFGLAVSKIAMQAREATAAMLNMGVKAVDAARLVSGWAVQQFRDAWDQLSGKQKSPKEEQAAKEREKAMLVTQAKLYKLQLQQRAAYLQSEASLTRASGNMLKARFKQEVYFAQGEAELAESRLRTQSKYLDAQRDLHAAEVAILNEAIAQMDALIGEIESTPIKIGGRGGGRRGGGGGMSKWEEITNRWEAAIKSLKEWLTDVALNESTTALTPQEQVQLAFTEYQRILGRAQGGDVAALEQLQDATTRFLELYKTFTGGGQGFLGDFGDIFDLIMEQIRTVTETARPRREANVIFDRRFHETQQDQLREARLHRRENQDQLRAIVAASNENAQTQKELLRAVQKNGHYAVERY